MKQSFGDVQKLIDKKLIPAQQKRAVINSIYLESWTADVQIVGSPNTILKNIPMSSAVPLGVKIGDRCKLDYFDEANPKDAVIAYTYGKRPTGKFSTGTSTVTTGGITIPHNLGTTPNLVFAFPIADVFITLSATDPQGGSISYIGHKGIFQSSNPDMTNIYLKSDNGSILVRWYAALI